MCFKEACRVRRVLGIPAEKYSRSNDQNRRIYRHCDSKQTDHNICDAVTEMRLNEVNAVVLWVGEVISVFTIGGDTVGTRDFEKAGKIGTGMFHEAHPGRDVCADGDGDKWGTGSDSVVCSKE